MSVTEIIFFVITITILVITITILVINITIVSPSPSPSSSSRSASISSYMIRCRQDWGRAVFLIFRSSHQGCQCTAGVTLHIPPAWYIYHNILLPHNTRVASALLLTMHTAYTTTAPPGWCIPLEYYNYILVQTSTPVYYYHTTVLFASTARVNPANCIACYRVPVILAR